LAWNVALTSISDGFYAAAFAPDHRPASDPVPGL